MAVETEALARQSHANCTSGKRLRRDLVVWVYVSVAGAANSVTLARVFRAFFLERRHDLSAERRRLRRLQLLLNKSLLFVGEGIVQQPTLCRCHGGKVWCSFQLRPAAGCGLWNELRLGCHLCVVWVFGAVCLTFPARVSMLTLRPTGLSSCHRFLIPMAAYNTARRRPTWTGL